MATRFMLMLVLMTVAQVTVQAHVSAQELVSGSATSSTTAQSSTAQLPPNRQLSEEEQETPLDINPETPEFRASVDKLREHLGKMNEVIVRYSVSDDTEDEKWRKRYRELTKEGYEIHQEMVKTALAEYTMDPAAKPELAEMLFRILRKNCRADRYEDMHEVAVALLENKYPDPRVLNYTVETAFATNRFQALEPYLEQLIERGDASPLLVDISEHLDEYKAWWEEEKNLREQDASGEPLPRVLIKTTKGDIEVELFENQAPNTVANFIHLAEMGFYDRLDFHRVLVNFMAQTGCPNEDGTGGPGYTIESEVDHPNSRKFFRGTLGLALAVNPQTRQEDPSSGGSQFFITFLPARHLNGKYTAFGRVVGGIEVLPSLEKINPDEKDKEKQPGEASIPDEVLSIEILNTRDHEYVPQKNEKRVPSNGLATAGRAVLCWLCSTSRR